MGGDGGAGVELVFISHTISQFRTGIGRSDPPGIYFSVLFLTCSILVLSVHMHETVHMTKICLISCI